MRRRLQAQLINSINLQENEILNEFNIPNFNDNLKNSLLLLNGLNDSINNNISQSVLDLVNCFICLGPVNEPLTCPKCNNFGCKKCFEKYFDNQREKPCPLCKRIIKLNELKENKIIEEVENILNKEKNIDNKINELSKLIEEKKKKWENQSNNINIYIEKIFKFQEELQTYKNEFDVFIINCQKLIDTTFQDVNKKIVNLINSLLSYNYIIDDSIKKYDDIYKKNQNKIYNNNDNIKKLINELLSLERKQFNDRTHLETEEFLSTAIKIIPSINLYHIKSINIKENDFLNNNNMTYKGNNYKLNDFQIVYTFNNENNKYKCNCKLTFTLKNDNDKKMCFLLSQFLQFKNKNEKLIPMKLIKNEGTKYIYECNILYEELFTLNVDEVSIKTEALIFTI